LSPASLRFAAGRTLFQLPSHFRGEPRPGRLQEAQRERARSPPKNQRLRSSLPILSRQLPKPLQVSSIRDRPPQIRKAKKLKILKRAAPDRRRGILSTRNHSPACRGSSSHEAAHIRDAYGVERLRSVSGSGPRRSGRSGRPGLLAVQRASIAGNLSALLVRAHSRRTNGPV